MPSVHRTNQSSIDDTFCQGPIDPPKPAASAEAASVTAWSPRSGESTEPQPSWPDGPTCSPHELRYAAQKPALSSKDFEQVASLERARAFVEAGDDSSSGARAARLKLVSAFAGSEAFEKLAASQSKDAISTGLALYLRQAAPNSTEAELEQAHTRLMKDCGALVQQQAVAAMKNDVTRRLRSAAEGFEKTANDPKALAELVSSLGPNPSADQREALGLEGEQKVDVTNLREAMRARAELMRHEGQRMAGAGELTIYRSLLLHFEADAGPAARGSWAAQGKKMVLVRGEEDEATIHHAKLASSVVLGAASGGLGVGAVISAGMVAGYNAPSLLSSGQHIEHAKAGVSAGTADPSAVDAAERKLAVEVAEAGVSMLIAGAGGHAAPFEQTGEEAMKHALKHGATELAVGKVASKVGDAVTPDLRSR